MNCFKQMGQCILFGVHKPPLAQQLCGCKNVGVHLVLQVCMWECVCVCVNRAQHHDVLYWFSETQCSKWALLSRQLMQQQEMDACVGSLQKMNLDLCIFHAALFAATSLRMHYAVPAAYVHITGETHPYPTSYRPGFLCAQIQLVVTDEDASVSTVESVWLETLSTWFGMRTLCHRDLRLVWDAELRMQQGHARRFHCGSVWELKTFDVENTIPVWSVCLCVDQWLVAGVHITQILNLPWGKIVT